MDDNRFFFDSIRYELVYIQRFLNFECRLRLVTAPTINSACEIAFNTVESFQQLSIQLSIVFLLHRCAMYFISLKIIVRKIITIHDYYHLHVVYLYFIYKLIFIHVHHISDMVSDICVIIISYATKLCSHKLSSQLFTVSSILLSNKLSADDVTWPTPFLNLD